MTTQLKVAVVGASGYSGEELVRLLARHPAVELVCVTSRSLAGTPVVEVMPKFRGLLNPALTFDASDAAALASRENIDLVFLALPHGVSAEYATVLVAAGKKVIDLSADFRLDSAECYKEYYGAEHPATDLLAQARYVIPEITPKGWQNAPMIAAPGCYPTSIVTPLYPLLKAGVVTAEGIVINSMSGISGAGKKVAADFLYAERAESAKAYSVPKHRHLSEIEEQLSQSAGKEVVLQFIPHLVPMRRGIISSISVPAAAGKTLDDLYAVWNSQFANRPFVAVLPSGTTPDSAYTVGTNRVDISAVLDKRTQRFIITSAEDNLLKGASGQAVQIMNLWFGFDETAGLL